MSPSTNSKRSIAAAYSHDGGAKCKQQQQDRQRSNVNLKGQNGWAIIDDLEDEKFLDNLFRMSISTVWIHSIITY
jgi:hypothetical protein